MYYYKGDLFGGWVTATAQGDALFLVIVKTADLPSLEDDAEEHVRVCAEFYQAAEDLEFTEFYQGATIRVLGGRIYLYIEVKREDDIEGHEDLYAGLVISETLRKVEPLLDEGRRNRSAYRERIREIRAHGVKP